jgi:hypothetical protein
MTSTRVCPLRAPRPRKSVLFVVGAGTTRIVGGSDVFRAVKRAVPFQSRSLQSPDCRVQYADEGSGKPILMCHGNPTWSFLYRHLIGELRDRFWCIAVE